MSKGSLILSLTIATACTVVAQEFPRGSFNIGAGFTAPMETAGEKLNQGWNAAVGVGVNFNPIVGLKMDFNYSGLGIAQSTLNSLGFPNGNVHMWSLTLNPVVHTNPRGPVDIYFTGGGGLFHWNQTFTQPTTATFAGYDPYFGIYYTVAVPANQVVSSYSVYKPGWDAGAGIALGARRRGRFYAEARFQRMIFGNNRYVDTIPVTFGFRW